MSSELGMEFGAQHHEKYAEVVDSWAKKLEGKTVTPELFSEWGADLHEALAEDLTEFILDSDFTNWDTKLPSPEVLTMFSQIAVKYSLQYATKDLLDRLAKSAKFNQENPPESVTAAIRPMRPEELSKRSPQTLAQIFDMAKDKFNTVLNRHFTKTNQFTGRRRWVTDGQHSRHAALDGEIKGPEDLFTYKGEKIATPRPVGGAPAHWSNCSCRLEYEKSNGKWVG